jgi:hypothetical protein
MNKKADGISMTPTLAVYALIAALFFLIMGGVLRIFKPL